MRIPESQPKTATTKGERMATRNRRNCILFLVGASNACASTRAGNFIIVSGGVRWFLDRADWRIHHFIFVHGIHGRYRWFLEPKVRGLATLEYEADAR